MHVISVGQWGRPCGCLLIAQLLRRNDVLLLNPRKRVIAGTHDFEALEVIWNAMGQLYFNSRKLTSFNQPRNTTATNDNQSAFNLELFFSNDRIPYIPLLTSPIAKACSQKREWYAIVDASPAAFKRRTVGRRPELKPQEGNDPGLLQRKVGRVDFHRGWHGFRAHDLETKKPVLFCWKSRFVFRNNTVFLSLSLTYAQIINKWDRWFANSTLHPNHQSE